MPFDSPSGLYEIQAMMHYYTIYLFIFFQGKNPVERAHLGRQRHLGCYLAAYSVLKNGKIVQNMCER